MNFVTKPLSAGLYFVATPIGSARDMTLRGLDILASADVLAAEDTRTARKLMDIHGVPLNGRQVVAFHDHTHDGATKRFVDAIQAGQSVAYVSEAGTPLVADPGYELGRAVIEADLPVTTAPGGVRRNRCADRVWPANRPFCIRGVPVVGQKTKGNRDRRTARCAVHACFL